MRRTHSNAKPGLALTPHAVQPVIKGGTGGVNLADAIANLDLIPRSLLGQPNGILAKVNGKIPANKITPIMTPTVTGKRQLFLGEIGTYTISNFDSNTEYTVTTSNGSITRNNETITFTPTNQIGNYSFVVNNKTYLVDVISGSVTKPSILTPTNNATGQAQLLTATASSFSYNGLNDTHVSSDWQISPSSDFSTITTAVSDSTTHKTSLTLSTPLIKNTTYYVRVRFKGANYGLSPWSDAIRFTTSSPGDVNTPSITSPTNNATNVAISFNVIANAFSISGTDTHEATDWQLATDSNFTNVFKSSLNDTVNKTSYTFTGLSNIVTYYLRVRYKGTLAGWSAFSPTIAFTTISAASINTPSITSPSNSATGQSTSPSFTSSSFSVSNGSDTHEGSDWQVATDASFSNVVKSVTNSSTNKTSWSTSGLNNNATYYVRVRHKGVNLGYGSWSSPSVFTTVAAPSVVTPSITSPSNGTTGVSSTLSIVSSSFAVANGADTHLGTDWQIATDSNFTNLVVNVVDDRTNKLSYSITNLVVATTYYLRVRYKGNSLGYSAWSTPITVSTKSSFTPSLETAKLQANDKATNDQFGFSVAISSDGNTAIIGAYGKDSKRGAAYVFTRSGNSWTEQAKLQASDNRTINDYFGFSVTISGDGNTAIIGAYGKDATVGAAYVFTRSGTSWSQQAKLQASDKATYDTFGRSVAISSDGNTAIIGVPSRDVGAIDTGVAYIFIRSGTSWSEQAKLQASDKAGYDQFGFSVAISSNGNTAIIGTPYRNSPEGYNDTGVAYIFIRSGTLWLYKATLRPISRSTDDRFGYSVAISSDGNTAIIGTPYRNTLEGSQSGVAYIFVYSNSTWTEQAKLQIEDRAASDRFGFSVAISGDGNTAIIGTNGKDSGMGVAYVFIRSGTSWSQQTKLQASDRAANDNFGNSVAISSDGSTAIIGAHLRDTPEGPDTGAAYIYS